MKKQDVIIIGGGIVGCAIAYELAQYKLDVLLLEKNIFFADETTKVNSGILHGGFNAATNKSKAHLNVKGLKLWKDKIFKNLEFPRKQVNSLVLAFNQHELQDAKMLYKRGLANKVPKQFMQLINRNEVIKQEPNINKNVVGALLCTSSWIIDPVKATLALIGGAHKNGVTYQKQATVTAIKKTTNGFLVTINNQNQILTKNIINAAGHYADEMAKMVGHKKLKQVARRGEYRILSKSEHKVVNSICFMMPTIHGKGVLVAPMVDGRILVGPTSEEGIAKEDTNLVTREKFDLIAKIGKHIIPNLKIERTEIINAASRPIDITTRDFVIAYADNNKHFINVGGMQSPAISAAPAIALEVANLLHNNGTKLILKTHFNPYFKVMW